MVRFKYMLRLQNMSVFSVLFDCYSTIETGHDRDEDRRSWFWFPAGDFLILLGYREIDWRC